jgi:hypothetical protein
MLRYLAIIPTDCLNYLPARGGISPYYSPHVIFTQRPLDFQKHCKVPFGAYVQANNEPDPTNTNAPRTIDCIFLPSFPILQGGHEVMDLRSGRVITRRNPKELPVTDLVIQAVENMAIQQGLTTLKFTNRTAPSIYPADWIAGVDYEEDDSGDSYYKQPDMEDQDEDLNEVTNDRIDNAELEDLFG